MIIFKTSLVNFSIATFCTSSSTLLWFLPYMLLDCPWFMHCFYTDTKLLPLTSALLLHVLPILLHVIHALCHAHLVLMPSLLHWSPIVLVTVSSPLLVSSSTPPLYYLLYTSFISTYPLFTIATLPIISIAQTITLTFIVTSSLFITSDSIQANSAPWRFSGLAVAVNLHFQPKPSICFFFLPHWSRIYGQ